MAGDSSPQDAVDDARSQQALDIALKELDLLRAENRHSGVLTGTLMAILSAYVALASRLILPACDFQETWGSRHAGCVSLPSLVFFALTPPMIAVLSFLVVQLSDIMQRDFYALEVERFAHRLASRPMTFENSIPIPSSYLLSRRSWDDKLRGWRLNWMWYFTLLFALLIFAGLSFFATGAGLHPGGTWRPIATVVVGLLWAMLIYVAAHTAIHRDDRWRDASAFLQDGMKKTLFEAMKVKLPPE
jgi:hypothetical protein